LCGRVPPCAGGPSELARVSLGFDAGQALTLGETSTAADVIAAFGASLVGRNVLVTGTDGCAGVRAPSFRALGG
jgi:hypothetical protein